MGLGGELHCSKEAGGFQPTLVCHTPAGISIQRDDGKERREKSEEKVRKLVLRRKDGLAKGPGVTVLVPSPRTHQSHSSSWTMGSQHSWPAPAEDGMMILLG